MSVSSESCSVQGKRILATMEERGALQAVILKKRLELMEHGRDLANMCKQKGAIDKNKYLSAVNALVQRKVKFPLEIALRISVIEAAHKFEALFDPKLRDEAEINALVTDFVEIISPDFGPDSNSQDFNPSSPRLLDLLCETLDACRSGFAELTPCLWEAPADEDEESIQKQNMAHRWSVSWFMFWGWGCGAAVW